MNQHKDGCLALWLVLGEDGYLTLQAGGVHVFKSRGGLCDVTCELGYNVYFLKQSRVKRDESQAVTQLWTRNCSRHPTFPDTGLLQRTLSVGLSTLGDLSTLCCEGKKQRQRSGRRQWRQWRQPKTCTSSAAIAILFLSVPSV